MEHGKRVVKMLSFEISCSAIDFDTAGFTEKMVINLGVHGHFFHLPGKQGDVIVLPVARVFVFGQRAGILTALRWR